MTLFQDFSFALRQLHRHRVYALTAIISMALGIGATAAVYSVLYGVLIDPYPYRDAVRLAFITFQTKQGRGEIPFTLSEFDQLRRTKSVEDALAQNDESMVATDGEIPQSVKVLEISASGFQLLGAPPLMGRVFTASEAREGVAPPPVAVISYLFWRSHFASDSHVINKVLELNQHKYTVIGVVGPRFTWHDSEVYLPMPTGMDPKRRFETLVRLKPGVSTAAAAGELTSIIEQIRHAEPLLLPKEGYTIRVETLNDWLLGQFKGTLFVLFAAVALLLLIGCGLHPARSGYSPQRSCASLQHRCLGFDRDSRRTFARATVLKPSYQPDGAILRHAQHDVSRCAHPDGAHYGTNCSHGADAGRRRSRHAQFRTGLHLPAWL